VIITIVCSCWDFRNEFVITSILNVTYENFFVLSWSPWIAANNEKNVATTYKRDIKLWNFFNILPIEKPFNYNPFNLMSKQVLAKAIQMLCPNMSPTIVIILCMKIIVNIKHGFPSCCCCFQVLGRATYTISITSVSLNLNTQQIHGQECFFLGIKTLFHIQHKSY